MQPYYQKDGISLYHGDLREVLPQALQPGTVDFVCTDPPYGLRFMEKDWDFDVPGPAYWRTIADVCKPGALLLAFGGTRTWHRLVGAIEDAGWEIRDCLMWLYGCLDGDTQCLTRRGWVAYDALTLADEVLQWDSNTGDLSWVQPQEIIIRRYTGKMVRLKNRHTDQLLTPNHRVYARLRRHSRYPWLCGYQVLEAGSLVGCSTAWTLALPMAGRLAGSIPVDPEWAYLVGWWLTDAWKHKDGSACMFSQSKPKTLAKLRTCLAPWGPSEYVKPQRMPRHDEHTFYLTGPAAARLLKDHPTRELTWRMLDWPLPARLSLVEGLLDGDGSRQDGVHLRIFWSLRPQRRAIFLALCLSLGWRAYDDSKKGCVYCNPKTGETQLSSQRPVSLEEYSGDVWCIRVPKGAFVVQRNGRPFITGNSGFPKSLDISKALDKAAGAEREIVCRRSQPDIRGDSFQNWQRHGKAGNVEILDTVPATELAKRWNGWGSSLKPAWEPIVLAMKPLDGTFAQNAQRHGVAGMNIDGCRIACDYAAEYGEKWLSSGKGKAGPWHATEYEETRSVAERVSPLGRWPANLLLQHHPECRQVGTTVLRGDPRGDCAGRRPGGFGNVGADSGDGQPNARVYGNEVVPLYECHPDCPVRRLDAQTGMLTSGKMKAGQQRNRSKGEGGYHGDFPDTASAAGTYGDSGGASRFFYCGKATKKERGPSNDHPTVKPLDLMGYLLTLLSTPTGGIILDPFSGSGTTLIAAKKLGRPCIGVELDAHNCDISVARLESRGL